MEYLITQGIIQIPIPITVAVQSPLTDDERAQSFVVRFSDGLIEKPFIIDSFVKFEATSSQNKQSELYNFPLYKFEDSPEFLLEFLPSIDKKELYEGIERWMNKNALVTPFDVHIDVMSGNGQIIQTWEYNNCEPTGYGTFVQDIKNFYQFVDQEKSEIRDRVTFACTGIHLLIP